MKKTLLVGATLGMLLSVSGTAMAYQYVSGYRTIAAQDASGTPVVVIGGQVYPVVATPSNEADKQHKMAWLQAQIDDLTAQMASLPADSKCGQ